MPSPISPIVKSLVRHLVDLIEVISETSDNQVQYWSWESRAEEDKLPKKTLLGLDNFQFEEREGLWEIACAIGLSTYTDVNLHEEVEILDMVFDACHEGSQIKLLDPKSGDELDQLVVSEFEISPMVQSMWRNYRTVNLRLKRTSSALS